MVVIKFSGADRFLHLNTIRGALQIATAGQTSGHGAAENGIATDKSALLPSQTATFANYTSYSRGINGIMIDIKGMPGTPTASDFEFRVGNDNNPAAWTVLATAPSSITKRAGAGVSGSDRVTTIWPNSTIQKQWLQVTMQANTTTGLLDPHVFYFGHALGEGNVGSTATRFTVTSVDALQALKNLTSNAAINNANDHNRDGRVTSADALTSLKKLAAGSSALLKLDLSGSAAP